MNEDSKWRKYGESIVNFFRDNPIAQGIVAGVLLTIGAQLVLWAVR